MSNIKYIVTIYVDKTTLEDLIEFQEIEFDIVKGYYFNEGHNTTAPRSKAKEKFKELKENK